MDGYPIVIHNPPPDFTLSHFIPTRQPKITTLKNKIKIELYAQEIHTLP